MQVEQLESRRHLSASVTFRSGGRLQVLTAVESEQIVFLQTSTAVQVYVDGSFTLAVGRAKLQRISIQARGGTTSESGNDLVDASQVAVPVTFEGGIGNETVLGGSGDDLLYGYAGDDSLIGNAGDDLFDGGAGADVMRGKDGVDGVSYEGGPSRVYVKLDGIGNDGQIDINESDNADGTIENITGSSHGDILLGNSRDNVIDGGPGSDLIRGFRGNDLIFAGTGKDTVRGDAGYDTYLALNDGARDWIVYGNGEDATGLEDVGTDVRI